VPTLRSEDGENKLYCVIFEDTNTDFIDYEYASSDTINCVSAIHGPVRWFSSDYICFFCNQEDCKSYFKSSLLNSPCDTCKDKSNYRHKDAMCPFCVELYYKYAVASPKIMLKSGFNLVL